MNSIRAKKLFRILRPDEENGLGGIVSRKPYFTLVGGLVRFFVSFLSDLIKIGSHIIESKSCG